LDFSSTIRCFDLKTGVNAAIPNSLPGGGAAFDFLSGISLPLYPGIGITLKRDESSSKDLSR
jgi:hypothetical protein